MTLRRISPQLLALASGALFAYATANPLLAIEPHTPLADSSRASVDQPRIASEDAARKFEEAHRDLKFIGVHALVKQGDQELQATAVMSRTELRVDVHFEGERIFGLKLKDGRAAEFAPSISLPDHPPASRPVLEYDLEGPYGWPLLLDHEVACGVGVLLESWFQGQGAADQSSPGLIHRVRRQIAAGSHVGQDTIDAREMHVFERVIDVSFSAEVHDVVTHRLWIDAHSHMLRRWDTTQMENGDQVTRQRHYVYMDSKRVPELLSMSLLDELPGRPK